MTLPHTLNSFGDFTVTSIAIRPSHRSVFRQPCGVMRKPCAQHDPCAEGGVPCRHQNDHECALHLSWSLCQHGISQKQFSVNHRRKSPRTNVRSDSARKRQDYGIIECHVRYQRRGDGRLSQIKFLNIVWRNAWSGGHGRSGDRERQNSTCALLVSP